MPTAGTRSRLRDLKGMPPMEATLPEHADACAWKVVEPCKRKTPPAPCQLTFLPLFPNAGPGELESEHGKESERLAEPDAARKRMRRSACRSITAADMAPYEGDPGTRGFLRKPNGAFLPPLYARPPVLSSGGDILHAGHALEPADADTIISSAEALLARRLRRGVEILRDPYLLLRFIQLRLVAQPRPVFAVFFLDRKQRLIRFCEIFHGQHSRVVVRPKEVVREAIACNAEMVLCVRSDPGGEHQPTPQDIEDARRVKKAMDLLMIEMMDYVIVGESLTSLRVRGVI